METDWQTAMNKGAKTLQQRKPEEAIRLFNHAIDLAESDFELAEAFHLLAHAQLETHRIIEYFESEKLAATYIAHLDAGQAADFMKSAGDVLERMKKRDLAAKAYCLASGYFYDQTSTEEDKDLQAAWMGWSYFCAGKSGSDCPSNFQKAADCFLEAAEASSSAALKSNRTAKSNLARGLSVLCIRFPSESDLIIAEKHLNEALLLEETNPTLKAACFAIDLMRVSLRRQTKRSRTSLSLMRKAKPLMHALKEIEHTFLLVSELDTLLREIELNPSRIEELESLNLLLLEILQAVS